MPSLNVQADLRRRLEEALGVPVRVAVPAQRPATFAVVRRNGGGRVNSLQDRAGVDVYSYAPTEEAAAALAARVSDFMQGLPRRAFLAGYESCDEETVRSDPDGGTGGARWYASYTITTHYTRQE